MKKIEVTAVISDDRRLSLQLPSEVPPGEHRIVLLIDEETSEPRAAWTMDDWPIHDATLVDPNFTMRREDLYGDDGR